MRMQVGVVTVLLAVLLGVSSTVFAAGGGAMPLFAEGFELLKADKLAEATAKFEQGLKTDPKNAMAHHYLAESYLGLKQTNQAKVHFQKALALDPNGATGRDAKERLAQLPGGGKSLARSSEFKDCPKCPTMVVLPAGQFIMGSPPSEEGRGRDEEPAHIVKIASPFAVGKYEVTFDEWAACVKEKDCADVSDEGWGRGKRPVINVTWDMAMRYARWLSDKTGKKYRLLSEAEWEYAARAGSDTRYFWGSEPDRACQFANLLNRNKGCNDVYANTSPVGSFKPNAFGLYDMLGNVIELAEDCSNRIENNIGSPNYIGAPSDGSAWKAGDCLWRVARGGSFYRNPDSVSTARREMVQISARGSDFIGFRVARTLP